jgi:hypothetical protein
MELSPSAASREINSRDPLNQRDPLNRNYSHATIGKCSRIELEENGRRGKKKMFNPFSVPRDRDPSQLSSTRLSRLASPRVQNCPVWLCGLDCVVFGLCCVCVCLCCVFVMVECVLISSISYTHSLTRTLTHTITHTTTHTHTHTHRHRFWMERHSEH